MRLSITSAGVVSAILLCLSTVITAVPRGKWQKGRDSRLEPRDSPPSSYPDPGATYGPPPPYYDDPGNTYGNPPPYDFGTSSSVALSTSTSYHSPGQSSYETFDPTATTLRTTGPVYSSTQHSVSPNISTLSSETDTSIVEPVPTSSSSLDESGLPLTLPTYTTMTTEAVTVPDISSTMTTEEASSKTSTGDWLSTSRFLTSWSASGSATESSSGSQLPPGSPTLSYPSGEQSTSVSTSDATARTTASLAVSTSKTQSQSATSSSPSSSALVTDTANKSRLFTSYPGSGGSLRPSSMRDSTMVINGTTVSESGSTTSRSLPFESSTEPPLTITRTVHQSRSRSHSLSPSDTGSLKSTQVSEIGGSSLTSLARTTADWGRTSVSTRWTTFMDSSTALAGTSPKSLPPSSRTILFSVTKSTASATGASTASPSAGTDTITSAFGLSTPPSPTTSRQATYRTETRITTMWINSTTSEEYNTRTATSGSAPSGRYSFGTLSQTSTIGHSFTSSSRPSGISHSPASHTYLSSMPGWDPGNSSYTYASSITSSGAKQSTSKALTLSSDGASRGSTATSNSSPPFPIPSNSTRTNLPRRSSLWMSTTGASYSIKPSTGASSTTRNSPGVSSTPTSTPFYPNSTSRYSQLLPPSSSILRTVGASSGSKTSTGIGSTSAQSNSTATVSSANSTHSFTYASPLSPTLSPSGTWPGSTGSSASNITQTAPRTGGSPTSWTVTESHPTWSNKTTRTRSGPRHSSSVQSVSSSAPFPTGSNSTVSGTFTGTISYTEPSTSPEVVTVVPTTWTTVSIVTQGTSTGLVTVTRVATVTRTYPATSSRRTTSSTTTTWDESDEPTVGPTTASISRPASTRELSTTNSRSGSEGSSLQASSTPHDSETASSSESDYLTQVTLTKVTLTHHVSFSNTMTSDASTHGTKKSSGTATTESHSVTSPTLLPTSGSPSYTTVSPAMPSSTLGYSRGTNETLTSVDTTCTHMATYESPQPASSSAVSLCATVVNGMTVVLDCTFNSATTSEPSSVSSSPNCGSSNCPTTSSTDSYETSWGLASAPDGTETYATPTTFKTSVTTKSPGGSPVVGRPDSSTRKTPGTRLPNNANYPWGGDSPVHRHENVTELNNGMARVGVDARTSSWPRWAEVVDRLRTLWS